MEDFSEAASRTLHRIPELTGAPKLPEGLFVGRSREIRVFEVYRPTSALRSALLRLEGDKCCDEHSDPQEWKMSLEVQFIEKLSVKVTVTASHPCGVKHISVWIAKKEIKLLPPFDTPTENYDPVIVNEHFIDSSKDIEGSPVEASESFTLPIGEVVGETFYVAGTASNSCGTTNAHSGGWVLI